MRRIGGVRSSVRRQTRGERESNCKNQRDAAHGVDGQYAPLDWTQCNGPRVQTSSHRPPGRWAAASDVNRVALSWTRLMGIPTLERVAPLETNLNPNSQRQVPFTVFVSHGRATFGAALPSPLAT